MYTDGCEALSAILDTGVRTDASFQEMRQIFKNAFLQFSVYRMGQISQITLISDAEKQFPIDFRISVNFRTFAFFAPVAAPTSEFGFGIARLK